MPSTRRRFLRDSSLAASALLAGPGVFAADERPNPAAASTAANSAVNVALVGAGGQGRGDMQGLLGCKQNVVAVCDPDPRQVAAAIKQGGEKTAAAKTYSDYRRLLDDAKSFDAVIIGTPDHWHAPLATAFIKAGKLKPIAVGSEKRVPSAPEVPTTAEVGMPQLLTENWYGMVAPAGTPKDVIATLNKAAVEAMKDPGVVSKLSSQGAMLVGDTPDQFGAFIASETAKWAKVIKDAGVPTQK